MRPHGKGVGGHRPYRRVSSVARLAASAAALDAVIKRAQEGEQARADLAKAKALLQPVFPEMFDPRDKEQKS